MELVHLAALGKGISLLFLIMSITIKVIGCTLNAALFRSDKCLGQCLC